MTPETTPLPGEFDPATPQCDWTPRRFAAEVFKQQAWVKERSDMTPVALPELERTFSVLHRFRSKVLGLATVNDRLCASTERGVYMMDKNGKRWRKIAAAIRNQP